MRKVENYNVRPTDLATSIYAKIADILPDWYYKPHFWEKKGRVYKMLGIGLVKKFVPTGGDRMVKHKRSINPDFHMQGFTLKTPSLEAMLQYEKYTRIHEATHVVGTAIGACLATASTFADNRLFLIATGIGTLANIYPVMLQRYNRERIYRVLERARRLKT